MTSHCAMNAVRGLIILLSASLSSAFDPVDVFNRTRECSLSSPEFTKCIHNAVQTIINDFAHDEGPEDEKMDPMLIPEISSYYGTLPTERMGISLANLSLHGLANTVVRDVRAKVKDLSSLRLEIDVVSPFLYLQGSYSAELMTSDEPTSSVGAFNVSILDVTGTLLVKGHVVVRDRVEYLQVDKASFKPRIRNMKFNLATEDDPYPELTTMVISLINSYWRIVFNEAAPVIEEQMDRVIREFAEELTTDVPFYEIVSP